MRGTGISRAFLGSAPPTLRSPLDPNLLSGAICSRADANLLEGVHSDWSHALTQSVLSAVPELASWDEWYRHPRSVSNGHVHTISAAKLRKTRYRLVGLDA